MSKINGENNEWDKEYIDNILCNMYNQMRTKSFEIVQNTKMENGGVIIGFKEIYHRKQKPKNHESG